MKDFYWKLMAALVKDILHDNTSIADLKSNFNGKMQQVGNKILASDPSLLADAQKLGSLSDAEYAQAMMDFIAEAETMMPGSNFGKAYGKASQSECKCPNLLNGHLNNCPLASTTPT